MWPLVHFAQSVLLSHQIPAWSLLIYPSLVAISLLLLGMFAFRKLGGDIMDEL
jgi:ABC-type polysaccharide/polyol phosphate export permease